jgi:maltose-binding protein MalE
MKESVIIFLLAAILAGCRGDEKRIMIWHSRRPVERQPLREALDDFRRERYPQWSFEERFYEPEECRTNFIISGLGGSGPALFWGASDNIGPFVDMQVIQPIEPFVDAGYINSFIREPFEANTWHKGHLYQVADEIGNHLGLIYNKDLVPVPPATMNELIALKDQIPENPDGTKPYVLHGKIRTVRKKARPVAIFRKVDHAPAAVRTVTALSILMTPLISSALARAMVWCTRSFGLLWM